MRSDGRAARLLRAWREDYALRTLLSAGASSVCTALFAAYNGYLGIRCGSVWHKSIAGFYLLLTAVRGSILVAELRTVNFIDALVAVLTLQNTLIMVEGTAADGSAMLPLTAVSSGAIYAVIVAVTIRMLQKGLARTRQAKKANAPKRASV